MKIAMAVRQFCEVGGAEKITRRLAAHLSESGHGVDVFAYRADAQDGVSLNRLNRPRCLPRAMRDWATGRGLSRALSRSGAEVTFGEQKTWGADVIRPGGGVEDAYWRARARYAPIIRHPAGRFVHPKRYFDVWAERNGYAHPSLRRVIVNSRMMRNQLVAQYPHLADRIEVIHNGVDAVSPPVGDRTARRQALAVAHGLDPSAVWLLFAGHEFKRKGLRHALRALARARAAGMDAQLVVVGRDRVGPYERERDRLGLTPHVAFAGAVPGMAKYYASVDALILPSHYDPFANVTMEAMGSGLPVITTRQNGGSELVDATAGWVIENPLAEEAMAAAIAKLADPARRSAMGQAARALAGKHLLQDKMKAIERVFLDVADEKRGAQPN